MSTETSVTEGQVDYLSTDWLQRFHRLVQASAGVHTPVGRALHIGYVVESDTTGDGGRYGVHLDGEDVSIAGWTAESRPADVEIVASRTIAVAIARGERSALDAFMSGDVRLEGDATRLVEARESLGSVSDVAAELAAVTRF